MSQTRSRSTDHANHHGNKICCNNDTNNLIKLKLTEIYMLRSTLDRQILGITKQPDSPPAASRAAFPHAVHAHILTVFFVCFRAYS